MTEEWAQEGLRRIIERAERIVELLRQVARKYPEETLPDSLKGLRTKPYRLSVGLAPVEYVRGRDGDHDRLEMRLLLGSGGVHVVKIPVGLWDAPESEITSWARRQYWTHHNDTVARRIREAETDLAHHAREIARLTIQLQSDQRDLASSQRKQEKRAAARHRAAAAAGTTVPVT